MNGRDALSDEILAATGELPTPFLIVLEKILRGNIKRIHSYCDRYGLKVRPHVKTHKSLAIGRMQNFYLLAQSGEVVKENVEARGCLV